MTESITKMPSILYGTAWKKERTADLVEQAIQMGFKAIDTACQPKHYDEKLVGVALQRLKEQGVNVVVCIYRQNLRHFQVKILTMCRIPKKQFQVYR